jgi:hypothetical protein
MSKLHQGADNEKFFPSVQERLKEKIKITQNVAAMLIEHGRTRNTFTVSR